MQHDRHTLRWIKCGSRQCWWVAWMCIICNTIKINKLHSALNILHNKNAQHHCSFPVPHSCDINVSHNIHDRNRQDKSLIEIWFRFLVPVFHLGASWAACQSLKRSSRSGWGFSGTWLDQLQRRTNTMSSPPRCDHHLIGADLLVDQDPPGWEW